MVPVASAPGETDFDNFTSLGCASLSRWKGIGFTLLPRGTSGKEPSARRQETWVQSPEDPLASHSSILAWRIPWTEEPGELQSIESKSRTRLRRLDTHPLPLFYDKSEKRDCQFVQIFLV